MNYISKEKLKNPDIPLESLCKEEDGVVFVMNGTEPQYVLMDIEYYGKVIEPLAIDQEIKEGLEDVKAGRVKPLDEVWKELDEEEGGNSH